MLIYKQFTFDSAHFLPNVPAGHKCKVIHGHTYKLTAFVEGDLLKEAGWLIDYADLKKAIMPVIEIIDHQFLNNIAGLENPTSEILVIWLWNKIKPRLPLLKRLELNETASSGVIYEE
jgi:6-pyruvoyltetrahydropterin/6-carboxytetrahydropterin synthase